MSMLSEWFATHKTSEATHAVLTELTEMGRLDAARIIEESLRTAGNPYKLPVHHCNRSQIDWNLQKMSSKNLGRHSSNLQKFFSVINGEFSHKSKSLRNTWRTPDTIAGWTSARLITSNPSIHLSINQSINPSIDWPINFFSRSDGRRRLSLPKNRLGDSRGKSGPPVCH